MWNKPTRHCLLSHSVSWPQRYIASRPRVPYSALRSIWLTAARSYEAKAACCSDFRNAQEPNGLHTRCTRARKENTPPHSSISLLKDWLVRVRISVDYEPEWMAGFPFPLTLSLPCLPACHSENDQRKWTSPEKSTHLLDDTQRKWKTWAISTFCLLLVSEEGQKTIKEEGKKEDRQEVEAKRFSDSKRKFKRTSSKWRKVPNLNSLRLPPPALLSHEQVFHRTCFLQCNEVYWKWCF